MHESHWPMIKENLKAELPSGAFRMWIEPLAPILEEEGRLTLGCPNAFVLQWIREKYLPLIQQTADRLFTGGLPVELKVAPTPPLPILPEPSRQYLLPGITHHPSRWNAGFTFEQFVTGPCNQFAYLATQAMAAGQNLPHPALFLFSSTGLGKTHLSQAVGHYLHQHRPQVRVLYLSVEDFTNEMIQALKTNSMHQFKEKYRKNCDFLLLEERNPPNWSWVIPWTPFSTMIKKSFLPAPCRPRTSPG